ncbi:MAG: class I SAM-dependent methyltransferase [Synechococcaceae cyanobacterium]|nr:class I SAM-dependent methyltransferase [Synechococcaceae cyanobacterium]
MTLELFDRRWTTYRRVLNHDLMEHQAVSQASEAAIRAWLAERPASAPAPRMVDLGCGDLALLVPLLRQLPLADYVGLDLSASVLERAAAALGPVAYPCRWIEGDLLDWACEDPAAGGGAPESDRVDLIHTAFAVHHLDDAGKQAFLRGCLARLAPDGLLLWADVFRPDGEPHSNYIQRYVQRVWQSWHPLNEEERQSVVNHLSDFDLPAEREAIVATARAIGWDWQWLWQGSHDAEAVAALRPQERSRASASGS